jgi:hypothetical protein
MIEDNLHELAAAWHSTGYWLIYALMTGLLLSSLWRIHRLREWDHHGYYGIVLAAMPWTWVRVVGMVLLFDDTLQHFVEAMDLENGRPVRSDWSPIHRLYVTVYQWVTK